MLIVAVLAAVVAIVLLAPVFAGRRAGRSGGSSAPDAYEQLKITAAQLEVQLSERDRQLDEARAERDAARDELGQVRDDRDTARRQLATAQADHEARSEELAKAREQIETHFKGIAADVVKTNSESFLEQAKEQFENQRKLTDTDLEKRQKAIDELVKPVKENLDKFEKQVVEMEKDRRGAYEGLRTQVSLLQETATGLSEALRSPQIRGQWGEQQLRNILELSGMSDRIDFVEQATVALPGDDKKGRPDAVVHIPGGLEVVIDAKTPLSSYLDAHHAEDEKLQAELLSSHARDVMDHAETLGKRDYAAAVEGSPNFVVMFLPADPILDAAMDVKPTLWEEAWQKHRVLIATPGLLLAFLRTVAVAWQQQNLQENAQKIADGAADLYASLRTYVGNVAGVGRGLTQAVNAYNSSIGSLEGRVLPRARKFEDWGVASGSKPIESATSVEASIRAVVAPELADSESGTAPPALPAPPDANGAGTSDAGADVPRTTEGDAGADASRTTEGLA